MHCNAIIFEYVVRNLPPFDALPFCLWNPFGISFVFIPFFGLCPNVPISGLSWSGRSHSLYIFFLPFPQNISKYFLLFSFSVIGWGMDELMSVVVLLSGDFTRRHQGNLYDSSSTMLSLF